MDMISDLIVRLTIRMRARFVGEDEFGNRYYESKKPGPHGKAHRYVLYKGKAEASKVPPDWHGWLHYNDTEPPPVGGYDRHDWQLPHQPNLTGTIYAWRPAGHLLRAGRRPSATGDYEPWKPE